jgi:hypothetical protein
MLLKTEDTAPKRSKRLEYGDRSDTKFLICPVLIHRNWMVHQSTMAKKKEKEAVSGAVQETLVVKPTQNDIVNSPSPLQAS